jgi:hypothetical protein
MRHRDNSNEGSAVIGVRGVLTRPIIWAGGLAACAVLAMPGVASAHDSEWCGHSQLNGNYWRLVYSGFQNEPPAPNPGGGTQARRHWHFADHYYRPKAGQGSYSFQHQKKPVCGYVSSGSVTLSPTLTHIPAWPVDPTDLPKITLQEIQPTAFTSLTSGAPEYEAVEVASPPPGDCLISIIDRFSEDGALQAGAVYEFANPAVAVALGHPCATGDTL